MNYPIILCGDQMEPDWPLPSFDVRDWAEAFCKLNPGMDEGLMISWFANALMRGYDQRVSEEFREKDNE